MANDVSRRQIVKAGLAVSLLPALPVQASTDMQQMERAIKSLFGKLPTRSNTVSLKLPALSENGYSVPVDVSVKTMENAPNPVTRIALFSSRNPVPLLAVFKLSNRTGRARVATRVRLGGTQSVHAVAEFKDGQLLSMSRETVVTLAACVIL